MRVFSHLDRLGLDRRGVAAVEFAIIAPMLIVLLMGILSYGGYFWTAHTLQQAANDAARAAIGGLSDGERQQLAVTCLQQRLSDSSSLRPNATQVDVRRDGTVLTVRVRYDARDSYFRAFAGLLPLPDAEMERSASIRLGGF